MAGGEDGVHGAAIGAHEPGIGHELGERVPEAMQQIVGQHVERTVETEFVIPMHAKTNPIDGQHPSIVMRDDERLGRRQSFKPSNFAAKIRFDEPRQNSMRSSEYLMLDLGHIVSEISARLALGFFHDRTRLAKSPIGGDTSTSFGFFATIYRACGADNRVWSQWSGGTDCG